MLFSILTLLTSTLNPSAAETQSASEPVFAELELKEALEQASRTERLVMIDFDTITCAPCPRLEMTFGDPKVHQWLQSSVIALRINAETDPALTERYEVDTLPTLVFLDPAGTEQGRLGKFKDAKAFLNAATDCLQGIPYSQRVREQLDQAGWNEPRLRQELGVVLMVERMREEALEHFIWCYDSGLRHDPTYAEQRLNSLLARWDLLGKRFTPAREQLEKRRQRAQQELFDGSTAPEVALELASIDLSRKQEARTLELYDVLASYEPLAEQQRTDVRSVLFRHVCNLLLDAKRYEDFLGDMGDPLAVIDASLSAAAMARAQGVDDPSSPARMYAIILGSKCYEAFLAIGSDAEASAVLNRILAFDSSAPTWSKLHARALRADRQDAADALAARRAMSEKK